MSANTISSISMQLRADSTQLKPDLQKAEGEVASSANRMQSRMSEVGKGRKTVLGGDGAELMSRRRMTRLAGPSGREIFEDVHGLKGLKVSGGAVPGMPALSSVGGPGGGMLSAMGGLASVGVALGATIGPLIALITGVFAFAKYASQYVSKVSPSTVRETERIQEDMGVTMGRVLKPALEACNTLMRGFADALKALEPILSGITNGINYAIQDHKVSSRRLAATVAMKRIEAADLFGSGDAARRIFTGGATRLQMLEQIRADLDPRNRELQEGVGQWSQIGLGDIGTRATIAALNSGNEESPLEKKLDEQNDILRKLLASMIRAEKQRLGVSVDVDTAGIPAGIGG